VPKALQLRARMGYVELDLRNATFAPGITTIDVRALMGYVEIRLPVGVRVENHGSALIGYIAVKGIEEDSETIVRITGRAVCGYAEIFLPDIPADEED
jgi:predicted membrane protein